MWSNILHIKHYHNTEIRTNNTFKVKSAFILQCSKWNFCVSTMYNNMKSSCRTQKWMYRIWKSDSGESFSLGGTSLHRPSSFADTCTCTNTSCRSFDTASHTSYSVIFISKVLIILMRDFGPCFTSMASVHASVVSIASAIFTTLFSEMIFMNINEWCIRSCKIRNSQLPMRMCAILCWQFQQCFRMI